MVILKRKDSKPTVDILLVLVTGDGVAKVFSDNNSFWIK